MVIRVAEDKIIKQLQEKPSICEEISAILGIDNRAAWEALNCLWLAGKIDWYCESATMKRMYFVENNPPKAQP